MLRLKRGDVTDYHHLSCYLLVICTTAIVSPCTAFHISSFLYYRLPACAYSCLLMLIRHACIHLSTGLWDLKLPMLQAIALLCSLICCSQRHARHACLLAHPISTLPRIWCAFRTSHVLAMDFAIKRSPCPTIVATFQQFNRRHGPLRTSFVVINLSSPGLPCCQHYAFQWSDFLNVTPTGRARPWSAWLPGLCARSWLSRQPRQLLRNSSTICDKYSYQYHVIIRWTYRAGAILYSLQS